MSKTYIDRTDSAEEICGTLILHVPHKLSEIVAILNAHLSGKKKRKNEYERLFDELAEQEKRGQHDIFGTTRKR